MTAVAPSTLQRTLAQRRAALLKANDVRSTRAQIKREVKAGRVQVRDLILDPPEIIETMKLWDLLIEMPKYGRVKVNRVFQLCRISPAKMIGGLSDRQRAEVVSRLYRR